jgi:DNA-binding CsgD family transcriptional regulator
MSASPSIESRLRSLLGAVEIIHHHGQGPFQDRVMAACQHLFPESYHGLELWDTTTREYEGTVNAPFDPATLQQRFQRLAEVIPQENPLFESVVDGTTDAVRLSDHTTLRQLRRTEYFDLAFAPLDLKHQVVIPIRNATHQGGVCFNKGGQQDYSSDDMEVIRLLGRHTMIAHESNKVLTAAQAQKPVVETADHLDLRRAGLTRRESEVLTWIAQGKRDREIAIILGISYRTVTNHVRAILTKLSVETRTAAVTAMQRL